MSLFKRICLVTANRSDYAKIRPFVRLANNHPDIQLEVFATGTMSMEKYGSPIEDILADGITPTIDEYCGNADSLTKMVKSMGLAMVDLASYLSRTKPDCGMVVGDRWDILPAAVAMSMMNIPIAHIQGGEISGTIDNVIRDVITKLSHIHFTATDQSRERVISLGECPDHVFNTGCPSIDFINQVDIGDDVCVEKMQQYIKDPFKLSKNDKYIIVILHPNVTEKDDIDANIVFSALAHFPNKKIWFYPNNDPFNDSIFRVIRQHKNDFIKFTHISMENFIMLLGHSACIVGNSSSGIREAASFGVPAINIGNRQKNRERNENVIDVPCVEDQIVQSIRQHIDVKFATRNLYGDGRASRRMINALMSYENFNYKNICK